MSRHSSQREGKAFAVGLSSLASFAFARPKGEGKAFAVGLPDLGLVTSLPFTLSPSFGGRQEGAKPHEKLGAWTVNFASNATSFFPEKQGRKIAYIRKKISVYKKIYFRICEKIFSHMRKFFSLRKQKNRRSEGRKIALRKPIFFSAQGGNFLT